MLRIKGFDKELKCKGFQFEVGKEYKIDSSKLELCTGTVFHYCKTLQQVNAFYDVTENNRYCYIEVLGEEIEDDDKCGSNHIKIVSEILGEELDTLIGRVNGNTGNFNIGNSNTGNRNTGYFNTGNRNDGDFNTGYSNTGSWNSGDLNTGNFNTGYSSTGDRNTGDWNTGDSNTGNSNAGYSNTGDSNTGDRNAGTGNAGSWDTGNCNTGNCNTGNCNAGDCNTGYRNAGDFNTGHFNACNYSSGFFCTEEPKARVFNQEIDMTVPEFRDSKYYCALFSSPFTLTEEIDCKFVKYKYKEACAEWWEKMSEENKKIVKSIPNFDAEIFEEITGIKEEK